MIEKNEVLVKYYIEAEQELRTTTRTDMIDRHVLRILGKDITSRTELSELNSLLDELNVATTVSPVHMVDDVVSIMEEPCAKEGCGMICKCSDIDVEGLENYTFRAPIVEDYDRCFDTMSNKLDHRKFVSRIYQIKDIGELTQSTYKMLDILLWKDVTREFPF